MGFMQPAADTLPRSTLIIGDSREEAGSGDTFAHIYPATGRVTREIKLAGPADVDRAVAAARAAFPAWRAMPGDKRRDLMFRLAALLEAKAQELVPSLVVGKRLDPARRGLHGLRCGAEVPLLRRLGRQDRRPHRRRPGAARRMTMCNYEPYGVVGAIIPWNGPLFAATMVMAPALAAGNCIVIKSPELAPYCVMRLVELVLEAGFPPGVVNLVTGGADVGEAMVAHPGIDKIQFIGCGATAKKVLASAAADAQALRPRAGRQVGGDRVRRCGPRRMPRKTRADRRGQRQWPGLRQRHTPAGRTLDLRAISADCFRRWPVTSRSAIRSIQQTTMGPVISEPAMQRILGMVDRGVGEGARLVAGGKRLRRRSCRRLLPARHPARRCRQRQRRWRSTRCSARCWPSRRSTARKRRSRWPMPPNTALAPISTRRTCAAPTTSPASCRPGRSTSTAPARRCTPCVPFGGWKQSGYGRLGGEQGLHEFLQTRNVWMNLAPPEAAR